MKQNKVTGGGAFLMLASASQNTNRELSALAAALVLTGELARRA